MLTPSSPQHQTNLFGSDLLLQLDPGDPLLKLADTIPWVLFDDKFAKHYCKDNGTPSKLIRLMVGWRRAAIEPIIGHLKSDFRLSRNFLKGISRG